MPCSVFNSSCWYYALIFAFVYLCMSRNLLRVLQQHRIPMNVFFCGWVGRGVGGFIPEFYCPV